MGAISRNVFVAGALAGCLLAPGASADQWPGLLSGRGAGSGGPAGPRLEAAAGGPAEAKEPWVRVTITEPERTVLLQHKDELVELGKPGKKKRLPPGLAKKLAKGGELPPGWQKKVARGEVMDRDLYLLSSRVPRRITQQMPPQPAGTVLVVLEGKIVRLIQATREILDVFDLH